jgi:hypothetical protein
MSEIHDQIQQMLEQGNYTDRQISVLMGVPLEWVQAAAESWREEFLTLGRVADQPAWEDWD